MDKESRFKLPTYRVSARRQIGALETIRKELRDFPATLIIVVFCLIYVANHTPLNQVDGALFLSYRLPGASDLYGKGTKDVYFVLFHATLFLSLRRILTAYLYPSIIERYKIQSRKRFSEQLLSLTYFSPAVVFGIYISTQQGLWSLSAEDRHLRVERNANGGNLKLLYLMEISWWLHEAIVLALVLEKKRNDYSKMIVHHLVALGLTVVSYYYNYTDFGLMVLVPHGASDVFLCIAKNLTYLKSSLLIPAWLVFTAVWLYGRHYLMIRGTIIAVRYFHYTAAIGQLPSWSVLLFFLSCAATLQTLNLFWLTLIIKGMRRAASSQEHHRDIRSDDEGEETSDGGIPA